MDTITVTFSQAVADEAIYKCEISASEPDHWDGKPYDSADGFDELAGRIAAGGAITLTIDEALYLSGELENAADIMLSFADQARRDGNTADATMSADESQAFNTAAMQLAIKAHG